MPKDNNNEQRDQVAKIHNLAGELTPGEVTDIGKQIEGLKARSELRKLLEEEEAIEQKKNARLAGIKSQVLRREAELAKQSQCPHKKPYGESALAGQRMHSHKYVYICQYCSKEFYDNDVPLDLRIDSERVGGPNA